MWKRIILVQKIDSSGLLSKIHYFTSSGQLTVFPAPDIFPFLKNNIYFQNFYADVISLNPNTDKIQQNVIYIYIVYITYISYIYDFNFYHYLGKCYIACSEIYAKGHKVNKPSHINRGEWKEEKKRSILRVYSPCFEVLS